ncbi:MAG: hypothetical protein C5B59_10285 [Bacteroidetes bacterium]|nr:MAG: hypothetical protein C5B59_10285 [Bacteroidota bacterium]
MKGMLFPKNLIILACFIPLLSHAQLSLGIEGGVNKNYLSTSGIQQAFTSYTGAYGAQVAIPVSYRLKNWLSVQSSISYVQKNYNIVRTGFFEGIHQNNKNNYIQVPLMAHFSFGGKKMRGFLNLGGYGAYWVSATVQGTEPNILNPVDSSFTTSQQPVNDFSLSKPYSFNEKYTFDSRKDCRWEWGLLAGVGLSYQLSQSVVMYVEGRFTQSLTDQQKNYMINQVGRYNQTYAVLAGAMVPVKIFCKKKAKKE